MKIHSVIVKRSKNGTRYASMPTHIGWKCGRCLTGQLGPFPRRGQECRVCRSKVVEVTQLIGEGFGAVVRRVDRTAKP